MELTAREIAHITGGELLVGDPEALATSFAIDSRVLVPGGCFVALTAARDGHDFVHDAALRGATVALVDRPVPGVDGPTPAIIRVGDPLSALGALGERARDALPDTPVIGITGSAGKTGTKDLVAAALGTTFEVHASPGSYNNEAGVPLTLLDADGASTDVVVLEMGARARGDIAKLCAIARPTVGVITNVGLAHAGPLGGPDGVALTKGELFEALPTNGLAVLDADDAASPGLAVRTRARLLAVSARGNPAAEVRATRITLDHEVRPSFTLETPWGRGDVRLGVHGDHQVVNAALAATVALDRGVPMAAAVAGLESVRPAPWRMEVLRGAAGSVVLNDAYNANPSSMAAAVRALAQIDTGGRRVAVLGEMRELGAHSEEEHARLGQLAADLEIDVLVAVGAEAFAVARAARDASSSIEVLDVLDAPAALDAVRAVLGAGDAVLVKGSRAVGLEHVAHELAAGGSGETRPPERVR